MRRLVVCLSVLTVSGCVTEMTPEANKVRQVTADGAAVCRFLGPVSGSEAWGFDTSQDAQSALNKMRNEVAAKGGNAYVLGHSSTQYDSTIVQADAYRCP